jgi:diguanylate cyclase
MHWQGRLWIRMALVGAALATPLVALVVYLAHTEGDRQRDAIHRQTLSVARTAAAQLADTLALATAQFELAGSLVAGQAGARDCAAVLDDLVRAQSLYRHFYLADDVGAIRCHPSPGAKSIDVGDRDYFRRTRAEGLYVSELVQGRLSQSWTIVIGKRLPEPYRELFFGAMNLDWLQTTLDNFALPAGSFISLADRTGRVAARVPFAAEFIGRPVSNVETFRGAGARGEGTHEAVNFAGVRSVIAYSQVPGHEMWVRVGVPTEVARNQYLTTLYEGTSVALAALLLAFCGGALSFRRLIGAPMQRLIGAAAKLKGGDLAARTGVAHDAPLVGELAATLDALAATGGRVTRALRALSSGNRTLLRNRDENQLLQEMCRVAVERAGYAVAYVCYAREDEGKSIDVMAQHGDDSGFIRAVPLTWADVDYGQGTVGRCIRSGERCVIRSISADPRTGPWKEAARRSGFAAAISLPLRVRGALIGTFTLMAHEDGFDDAEIDLLDEMAADLSFGIEVIRSEARRREAEGIAQRALTHDPAIDVPNRAWFVRHVTECIERGRRNAEPVAVLDVHLGRLQDVLDSFGYEHGNAVLREVAQRLAKVPGCDENLGRLPVDDFGIVLCGHDAAAAERVASAALRTFGAPVCLGGALVDVQAAVGVSFFPGQGDDAEVLMRRASIAARHAFRREMPYVTYSRDMARENPARLSLATELRAALETRQLALHFQPKLTLKDSAAAGCEALVRWPHPTRGMVQPVEFIGLAEEIGLIRPLTYQVIDLAARQLYAWAAKGLRIPVAVNLSARNLYDPRLLEVIESTVRTWGVDAALLHFEITEGALVDDPDAARRTLLSLAGLGAKVYIDDFGTGYSCLSYLVSLPVHALKIDRSFIREMSRSAQARGVVASIISMAHSLKLEVVAEGVETAGDAAALRELGCDTAQGYFYSRPLPATDYEAWHQR